MTEQELNELITKQIQEKIQRVFGIPPRGTSAMTVDVGAVAMERTFDQSQQARIQAYIPTVTAGKVER